MEPVTHGSSRVSRRNLCDTRRVADPCSPLFGHWSFGPGHSLGLGYLGIGHSQRALFLSFLLLVVVPAVLSAQTVTLQLEREAIYGAEDVDLYVRISGAASGLGVPRLDPVAGLTMRGPSSPSSRTQIINGQISRETIYRFRLTPRTNEARSYTIGPVTVPRRGGTPLTSNRVTLKVYRRPPPGISFERDVSQSSGATLSPFLVTYTVYYSGQRADEVEESDPFDIFDRLRNRSGAFGLTGLALPLLQRPEVKVFPFKVLDDRDGASVPLSNDHRVYIQEGSAELDGFGYQTLVFGFQVVPLRSGRLEIAPAEVSMRLVGGQRERTVRDFFGRTGTRIEPVLKEFSAKTRPVVYEVQNPPPQGRPASYNGAVGRYSIEVSASPTEVDAFTPIKVQARVRCENRWREDLKKAILENLSAPKWSREESLTTDFDVSSDVHPGTVEDDVKVFTQTLRPLGAHVKEIPPLPFPYYDPEAGTYDTAYSRPIPLTVRAVDTVGGGHAIRNPGSQPAESITSVGQAPVVSIVEQSGIAANFPSMGLAQGSLDPRREITRASFIAVLAVPPLVFALALVARRLRRDPSRLRRDRALSRARSRLARAESSAEEAAAAFQDYFRDRVALGSGELTPGDLTAALNERGVPEEPQSAAVDLLERFLSARFGGGGASAGELAQEADRLLRELDRCLR